MFNKNQSKIPNKSTVEIVSPEELIKELQKKIRYSDLSDEYKKQIDDFKSTFSQTGANKLYVELDGKKINYSDMSNLYVGEENADELKVPTQFAINHLYNYIEANKIDFKDLVIEFDLEEPDENKAFSQTGANNLYNNIKLNFVNKKDITNEFIVDEAEEEKVLSQVGAKTLYELAALKKDIRDDFEKDDDDLVNKIFSLAGARTLYKFIKENFVDVNGSEITGDLDFLNNGQDESAGISFKTDEQKIKISSLIEDNILSMKIKHGEKEIIKISNMYNMFYENTIFQKKIGVESDENPKYTITIKNDSGINFEDDSLVFYLKDEPVMRINQEGVFVFESNVSTENKPSNAISIIVEKQNHSFENDLVSYFEGEWQLADLRKDITADGFAIKISDDLFKVVFHGIIDLTGVKDEKGDSIKSGEFYFVSQTNQGKFSIQKPYEGLEQIAFKTFFADDKMKAQLLLTDEANFNLLTNFKIDDSGNVSNVENIYKLLDEVEDLKQGIGGMFERIQELEGIVTDYEMLYESNFVEETYINHPFLFNALHNNGERWELADLTSEKTADAIAIKKSNDIYITMSKGTVEIPDGALDDKEEEFVPGEYYYVSATIPGAFSRYKNDELDIDQLAFKVIKHKGKNKAIVLISDDVNIGY